MTTMTTDIQKDSRFIKILTFIAMLYTPASLMAVSKHHSESFQSFVINLRNQTILSSNLVRVVGEANQDGLTHLVLVSDFWKYPVLTGILIIITLLPVFAWRRVRVLIRQRISRLL
jgi:hypothetical protein